MAEGLPRVLLFTRGDLVDERGAEALAAELRGLAAAAQGRSWGLVLREPDLDDRACLGLACALAESVPWLAVHDRIHLARAAGADGVHLGWRSLALGPARAAAGGLALGLSTHAEDDPATWRGADYLTHGPIAPTSSKAGLVEPIGIDGFARGLARRPDPEQPVLALGGVTRACAAELLAAGAHGVAVIGAVLGAEDPPGALLDLLDALG